MPERAQKIIHEVQTATVVKVVLVLAAFVLLYIVRDVLLIFFVALILAAVILPAADFLQKKKIPRAVTALGIYVVIVALFLLVLSAIVPPLLDEIRGFLSQFSEIWSKLMASAGALSAYTGARGFEQNFQNSLDSLTAQLPNMALGAFSSITGVVLSLFSLVVIFVLAFYIVVQGDEIKRFVKKIWPDKYHSLVDGAATRVQKKLGGWVRAQFVLSLTVAVLVYLIMLILGMPYALVLAVLAGLLEVVPYAGPIIAGVPAVLLALSISPLKALFVVIGYILIQQIEGNLLIPKINQKFVGVNPVVSILAMLLGARLAGFLGVLIAIPLAATITMLLEEYLQNRRLTRQEND